MIEKLKEKPHSVTFLGRVIGRDPETIDLTPLVEEGVIARIGVTPTDILHAQGKYNQWNRDLSHAGINILAKRYEVSEDSFYFRGGDFDKSKACIDLCAGGSEF
mgnify:CR=1 FL=1